MRRFTRTAAAAILAACVSKSYGQLAAFPGAVGFGAATTGGRGGAVYVVTNLNDSGAGSFRDAVSEPNRIIVFAVGGYVTLASAVSCSSNLTILGQTAPGQGIGFMGHEVSFSDESNDVIQYLRFREGSTDTSAKASLNLGDLNGGIVDHVSAEFSQYDNIDAVGANSAADNITYSNDLIADAIKAQQLNLHEEGNQTTYVANVFANAHGRDPLAKSNDQYVNNVVYDYGYAYTTGDSSGTFKYDILNNYFIAGPSTTSAGDAWYQLDSNQSAYASGNLLDSNKNGVLDGTSTTPSGLNILSQEWSPQTQYLPTLSATNAYSFDVAHAGDSLNRDQVDSQIISQVQSLGTQGEIYNEQSDDGLSNNGFGTIAGGTAPTNTAGDGIADSWKITHGLNVNVADSTLLNALGYTMIEEYAQQLGDEYASQTWSSTSGDWTIGTWSATTPGIYDHALIRGNGTLNGAVTLSGSDSALAFTVSIGGNGPSSGESLTVSGGHLQVLDTIYVGDQNTGNLNMSGGTVRAANVQLGNTVFNTSGVGTTYTGNFNFTGGTLQLQYEIVQGGGTPGSWTTGSNWLWSGGTLQAAGTLSITAPATIGSGNAIVNMTGYTGTCSSVLSGSGSLVSIGSGTLLMAGTSTFTGPVMLTGGTIATRSYPAGPGPLGEGGVVLNGGTLQFLPTAAASTTQLFSMTSAGGDVDSSGASTFTLSGPGTITQLGSGSRTLTLSGITAGHNGFAVVLGDPSSGVSNLVKIGTGEWDLDAIQTYSGNTTVNAGTLETLVNNALAFGTGKGNLVVNSPGVFEMHDESLSINALTGSGTIQCSFGTKPLTIGNGNAGGLFSGNMLSGIALTKVGTGLEELSGTNSYVGGTTISGGVIQFDSIGSIAGTAGNVLVGSGGAVAYKGGIATAGFLTQINPASTGALALLSTDAGATLNFTTAPLSSLASMAIGAVGSVTYTGSYVPAGPNYLLGGGGGTLAYVPSLTGSYGLQVGNTGSLGEVVLSNPANSYAGATTVQGGTLIIGTAGALPIGTSLAINSAMKLATGIGPTTLSSLTMNTGSTLDVADNPVLINYGSSSNPITAINSYLANGLITSSAVTAANSSQNALIYALGSADGADGVVSGLSSGEIEIIPALAGDAQLQGNVDFGDFQILAADFGSSAGWDGGNFTYASVVNFADFQMLAQNFGADASGLTASELASLNSFALIGGEKMVENSDGVGYSLVAVPEPATAGVLAAAGVGLLARRRRNKRVNT